MVIHQPLCYRVFNFTYPINITKYFFTLYFILPISIVFQKAFQIFIYFYELSITTFNSGHIYKAVEIMQTKRNLNFVSRSHLNFILYLVRRKFIILKMYPSLSGTTKVLQNVKSVLIKMNYLRLVIFLRSENYTFTSFSFFWRLVKLITKLNFESFGAAIQNLHIFFDLYFENVVNSDAFLFAEFYATEGQFFVVGNLKVILILKPHLVL